MRRLILTLLTTTTVTFPLGVGGGGGGASMAEARPVNPPSTSLPHGAAPETDVTPDPVDLDGVPVEASSSVAVPEGAASAELEASTLPPTEILNSGEQDRFTQVSEPLPPNAVEQQPRYVSPIELRLLDQRLEQLQLEQQVEREEMGRLLEANQVATERLQNPSESLTSQQRLSIQYQIDQRQQIIHTLGRQMDQRYETLSQLLARHKSLVEQATQAQVYSRRTRVVERRHRSPYRLRPYFGIGVNLGGSYGRYGRKGYRYHPRIYPRFGIGIGF